MEQYLVQSYTLMDTYQPPVVQVVEASKVEIKDHLAIFYDDKDVIASFDLSQVFFAKMDLTEPEGNEELQQKEANEE